MNSKLNSFTPKWAIRFAVTILVALLALWVFVRPGRSKNVAEHTHPSASAQDESGRGNPALSAGAASGSPAETAGSIPYVVKRGESVVSIAWRHLPESIYMKQSALEDAIRQANHLGQGRLQPGEHIVIPGIPEHPALDKPVTVPKNFDARAIYLTGYTAGSERGLELIERWKAVGGNAVVFDIKDFDGEIRVPFNHKYAPHEGITIRNLPKLIHWLHARHVHVIARIALFRDAYLAATQPQFDVRSRQTGKPWLENGKLAWVDPSLPEVQQYELDLARMAASSGADEIQFDYVRFPAEGNQADAEFSYQKEHPDWPRSKIITGFVSRASQELHPMGVLVSLDVFGVMAWARPADLEHTGQDIAELSHHCDVISPMIYPSHFFHFDGYTDPGDAPEHFIAESMKRFEKTTQGSGVTLRPWLQAFAWRTKSYSVSYVLTEMRVAAENGGDGFLFWNADNNYPKPLIAMAELRSGSRAALAREPATASAPPPAHGSHL
ncbi:MAG: putative glycoside hydrolase [Terriglobia bacterium]